MPPVRHAGTVVTAQYDSGITTACVPQQHTAFGMPLCACQTSCRQFWLLSMLPCSTGTHTHCFHLFKAPLPLPSYPQCTTTHVFQCCVCAELSTGHACMLQCICVDVQQMLQHALSRAATHEGGSAGLLSADCGSPQQPMCTSLLCVHNASQLVASAAGAGCNTLSCVGILTGAQLGGVGRSL